MKNKCFVLSLLMLGLLPILSAQKFHYEKDEAALKAMLTDVRQKDEARHKRVDQYLQKHPVLTRSFKADGNTYLLHDIENDQPVYYVTHNDGSVKSVNADEVRAGGRFGLNITGSGLRIAVWDAGTASRTHVEYQNRLLVTGGSEIDDHACHVIGTIMAGGVNPNAKGFLYEAIGIAYWWDNDTQEMIAEALNEDLLASNHSYGIPAGWSNGSWRGDPNISEEEDYKFGFYNGTASQVDNIAFSAPYYCIFKSAGNDRGDSGNGPYPTDGPFDCISDWGNAKNVFTIGAVQKTGGNYTGPNSIVMSTFSSWGPTDDGRIKPDFVMPGVGIFSSTCEEGDDKYSSFNGTSMASPGALGATMLINEAYKQFNNTYLKSATLKALMVQTAMEAGSANGPDYSFGWGMIDVEAAVDLIIAKDGINTFILEETLLNQDSFVMELNPVAGQKLTATIAWTDPAGSPAAPALDPTKRMLVNDLDMRIVDELGIEVKPWILDPALPGKAAGRGDNFRDNVEKIEFDNPQPRRYFLKIKHKGNLSGGKQNFSLVVKYTSEDPGIENLYWVGGNGNWSDQGHWSLTSGGTTSNLTPGPAYKLIFDDNSFTGTDHTVHIDQDFTVAGMVAINRKKVNFDLGGHNLTVTGTVLLASKDFTFGNGSMTLEKNDNSSLVLDLNQTKSETLQLIIGENNQATWNVSANLLKANSLAIKGGNLFLSNTLAKIGTIQVMANAGLQINQSTLENFTSITIDNGAIWSDDAGSSFFINNANITASLKAPGLAFLSSIQVENGSLSIEAPGAQFDQLNLDAGTLTLQTSLGTQSLSIQNASALLIRNGIQVDVFSELNLQTTAGNLIQLVGTSEGPNGVLHVVPHRKFCFNYLDIKNLDLSGNAAISVGENSQVEASANWFIGACPDLLFANFGVQYACANGITYLNDLSEGNVSSQKWFVNGEEIATGPKAEYFFATPGTYDIGLEITDGLENYGSFVQSIQVVASELEANSIIQNPTQLASLKVGDSYQWYKNYAPIPGATGRVYAYGGEQAVYFVLTFKDGCNRISEVLDLLGTAVENLDENPNTDIQIYPNPVQDMVYIQSSQAFQSDVQVRITNAVGQLVYQGKEGKGYFMALDMSNFTPGIYILGLSIGDQVFTKKLIKNE
ncbi:MAG: S8/S53 family peptidase [Saprospiraceae bacterium]